jgi:hypothetical protein
MTVGGARGARRIATALLRVLLAAACTPAERPRPRPPASWHRVDPGGTTRCARGGRYAFWARVADPSKPVVFFQGGGCFEERSCEAGSTWFDDSVTDADDPAHAGGMLAMTDPRNPSETGAGSSSHPAAATSTSATGGCATVRSPSSSAAGTTPTRRWTGRSPTSQTRPLSLSPAAAPAASARRSTSRRSLTTGPGPRGPDR